MKIVCISESISHLTKGKIYETRNDYDVAPVDDHNYYYIINDINLKYWYDACHFINLSNFREEKINEILGL